MKNLIPVEFQKYYRPATIAECETEGFYMEDYTEGQSPDAFKYYPELEFLGWAIVKDRYKDALQEHDIVCIVKDNEIGDITLVEDFGDRVYDVDFETIVQCTSEVDT